MPAGYEDDQHAKRQLFCIPNKIKGQPPASHSRPGAEIFADLWNHVWVSRFGLGIAWLMVQSIYTPKFSPLIGRCAEIFASLGNQIWASRFALDAVQALQPRPSSAHGLIYLHAEIQPSKWSGFRDIGRCHVFDRWNARTDAHPHTHTHI